LITQKQHEKDTGVQEVKNDCSWIQQRVNRCVQGGPKKWHLFRVWVSSVVLCIIF